MNFRRIGMVLMVLGSGLLVAACGFLENPNNTSTPGTMEPVRVTGTITWRERVALPPDAQITVRLQDVSRMDAPAVVMAEQRFNAEGRQVPIPFELAVDPARIDPRMRYAVSARVERQGQLLFINDTAYPVLTQGAGYSVNMVLVRAGQR